MDNDHEEDTWETFRGSPNTGAEDTGHPLLDPGSPSGAFSPSSSTPKPREADEETTLLTVDGEPRPEYPDETQPTQSEAADAGDNEDDSTLPVSVPPVEESASMPEDQTATEPGSALNHHENQNRGDAEVISNISGGSGRDHDDEDTEVNEDGERGEGEAQEGEEEQPDPWSLAPDFTGDDKPKWSELSTRGKVRRVCIEWIGKALGICACIYFFIVALSLMGDAFTLIGGSAAGAALSDSSLLKIPIAGLMIGMLVTVLLQSSSATTSIIVSMVASDIINVPEAIPMVMGANLGTSVTNTIVAGGQAGDRETFRRSFAGATVHDCFNWLAVLVLLPIESISGYLYHLTTAIVKGSNLQQIGGADRVKISDPITKLIIQLDLQALEKIALGEELTGDESFVKRWCVTEEYYYNETVYDANGTLYNYTTVHSYTRYIERCKFLFAYSDLADEIIGVILLIVSLLLLMGCLMGIVKLLSSVLKSSAANSTKKFLNASFPGYLSWLTGYVAMLIGVLFTMLLQSSSVFTSLLTPLVGVGIITVERMYPLTLGSNIGTTFTSLIAAFASSDSIDFVEGVQISLCHLFFNLSGIILFYPIPITRKPPINGAKFLGSTTAKYRWFSLAYVLTVFFILPLIVLLLAIAGWQYLAVFMIIVGVILIFIITLKILQKKCPNCLPVKLRNWKFLPEFMRSLKPYDRLISRCLLSCGKCRASCKRKCKCCKRCRESPQKDKETISDGQPSTVIEMQVVDEVEDDVSSTGRASSHHGDIGSDQPQADRLESTDDVERRSVHSSGRASGTSHPLATVTSDGGEQPLQIRDNASDQSGRNSTASDAIAPANVHPFINATPDESEQSLQTISGDNTVAPTESNA